MIFSVFNRRLQASLVKADRNDNPPVVRFQNVRHKAENAHVEQEVREHRPMQDSLFRFMTLEGGKSDTFVSTASGLKYKILSVGSGSKPEVGQAVSTDYTGWLGGFESGKIFDSSFDRHESFNFKAGRGEVIKAWDEAILDMRVGERRRIIVPPELGYGQKGAGGVIPPNSVLYFELILRSAASSPPSSVTVTP
jgi:FKBP-type peptidyl-prolyl cis-trans isomerase